MVFKYNIEINLYYVYIFIYLGFYKNLNFSVVFGVKFLMERGGKNYFLVLV